MAFNLKNLLEEKIADINPYDGGKTGATVRANRAKPAPAQTVSKAAIPVAQAQTRNVSIQQAPQRTVRVVQPMQQQATVRVVSPRMPKPAAPKKDWGKLARDSFWDENPVVDGAVSAARGVARIPEQMLRSVAGLPFEEKDQDLLTSNKVAGIPGTEGIAKTIYGDPIKTYQQSAKEARQFLEKSENPTLRKLSPAAHVVAPLLAAADATGLSGVSAGTTAVTKAAKPLVKEGIEQTVKVAKDANRALEQTNPRVKEIDEFEMPRLQQAFDLETNPVRRVQINRGLAQLSAERRSLTQGGYVRIPGDASDDLVKKVFLEQSDDNALYHGTKLDNALQILESGKIKASKPNSKRELIVDSKDKQVSLSRQRNSGFYNSKSADVKFVVDKGKIGKTKAYVDGDLKPSDYTNPSAFEAESQFKGDIPLASLKRIEGGALLEPADEAALRALAEKRGVPFVAFDDTAAMRSIVPKRDISVDPKSVTRKARSPELSPELAGQKSPSVASASTSVQLNTKRIALSKEARKRIAKETSEVVNKLSNKEVKEMATKAGIDFKSYGVAGTKKKITEQLNVRNEILAVEKQIKEAKKAGDKDLQVALMQKSAELGRISRSQGTDIARQLQARRIIADTLATPQQKLYRLFDEAGVDPEVYTKRMADVDMGNPADVVKAYRDLVPAKFADWLDKYRYTNMLSSPLTHIVNITSNVMGLGGIAPTQKLVEGAIDATRAALTGGERTRFASEAGSFVAGSAKSLPEALNKFKNVMTGKSTMDMPDADALKYGKLASGGVKGAADEVLSFIPKLLEASDQFVMTLARGGERASLTTRMNKGVAVPKDLDGVVDDAAKYRVFRQELGKDGQGAFLEAIDFIPNVLLQARSSKNAAVSTIAKFTIPFVTTPTNLFKQGLEYSPAGLLTLAGNADKTAQLAKMTMGTTTVALATAALASKNEITFNEPSDAKQRDAFRAEGKLPYSVKVGDTWVQYSKLHPAISFNLAMVGAVKEALDKGTIDQSTADKIMEVGGGVLGFFRDQSYMKSVGDFTSALEMKDGAALEDSIATVGSNWANQLVPFKSMVSWIGRQVDPTQRKTDYKADALTQIYQNVVKDIPGLNSGVPTRNNPYYKDQEVPITNPHPTINAFSPLRISTDKGYGDTSGLNITERREMLQLPDGEKASFRSKALQEKAAEKIAKENGTTYEKPKKPDTGWTDEYNAAKKDFDENSSKWSAIERYDKDNKLKTLDAKRHFSKDTTRLYDMAEKNIYAFLDSKDEKEAAGHLDSLVRYGDLMVERGLWKTNKLRDKYGNVQYTRGYSTSDKSTSSSKKSGGRVAKGGKGKGGRKASKGKFSYKLDEFVKPTTTSGKSLRELLSKAKIKQGVA